MDMVKHINVAVDDDLFERGKAVKDERDMSWEEFWKRAIVAYEQGQIDDMLSSVDDDYYEEGDDE